MKLAIVCDDLIQCGGAEKVLETISDIFPRAPIYTSVASKNWIDHFEKKGRVVKTSFFQKFPFSVKLNRYYAPFFLHILAFEGFDFSDFDIVVSCSTRFAHFVVTKPTTKHICYMNSPGRMFWEPFDYFENESYGFLKPLKFLAKSFLKFPLSYIRLADYNASQKVDLFISNSKVSQGRIKKYYGKESAIVHPFINFREFENVRSEKGDYYLVLTRLVSWKKVDIAIKACKSLGIPLKIIGVGPDLNRLKLLADSSTEFLGYGEGKKMELLRKCKAVIITQKEDFGIVPLEAMACGKPVIAFGEGGAAETIIEGKTGEFFKDQTPASLESIMKDFNPDTYSPEICKSRAKEFDVSVFVEKIKGLVFNNV